MKLRDGFNEPVDHERTPSCPDDEVLWQAARGELDAESLAPILDHVAGCASCTESWRMALAIGEEAGLAAASNVVPFYRRPVVWGLVAVAASLLIVSLFVPGILDSGTAVPADEFRDASSVALESLLDETVAWAPNDVTLRWSPGPEGTLYTVELADANLDVLGRSEQTDRPEYRVPAETLAGQPAGSTVYWRVDAVVPDGTRVRSAVFLLRLQ